MNKKHKRVTSKSRNLRLSRQTVRMLSIAELAHAAGATRDPRTNEPTDPLYTAPCPVSAGPIKCYDNPGR